MNECKTGPRTPGPARPAQDSPETAAQAGAGPVARSMHEDVPDWYDCCSCEVEPYWLEALGEGRSESPEERGGTAADESAPARSDR
jgi:hypothetical protein